MENCRDYLSFDLTTLGGFQENPPRSTKNKLQQIQLSDMTGSSNDASFCSQVKLKKELFGSKHARLVWCTQG